MILTDKFKLDSAGGFLNKGLDSAANTNESIDAQGKKTLSTSEQSTANTVASNNSGSANDSNDDGVSKNGKKAGKAAGHAAIA